MENQINKQLKLTDRISGLPEPIIHRILSFLPNNDVKLDLKLLSKTWYHICSSCPYLDFNDRPSGYCSCPSLDKYVNFVTKSLERFLVHKLRIQRLTIPIPFFRRNLVPVLESWVELALQHGVHEFNLEIRGVHPKESYNLPPAIFRSESINVAYFVGCSLLRSFPPHDNLSGRSNLLNLSLDHVFLNEASLSCIASSCPLIEELSMVNCRGMEFIQISNVAKLKTLRIERTGKTVEIHAPCLQSLNLGWVEIVILECPKLTHLDLYGMVKFDVEDILSRFSLLHSLCLSEMHWLTKVKVSSHTLNKLKVVFCNRLTELDAPNLHSVVYKGVFSSLASLTHNVTCPWDVSILHNYQNRAENYFVQLRNFVSNVKHIDNLYLCFGEFIPFDEINERVVQPVGNVDHLELCLMYPVHECYPPLVECLLWTCHPRTLSLTHGSNISSKKTNLIESLDKIIACHRDCCSCVLLEASQSLTYLSYERWK